MIRTTQLTVGGGHLFDVGAYTVTLDDEGGGEFLVVEENQEDGAGKIRIDRASWPLLKDAIERMLCEARP